MSAAAPTTDAQSPSASYIVRHGAVRFLGEFSALNNQRFLRGTDQNTGRDPNRAVRAAMNSGGNTGDQVGSVQSGATALPAAVRRPTPSGPLCRRISRAPRQSRATARRSQGRPQSGKRPLMGRHDAAYRPQTTSRELLGGQNANLHDWCQPSAGS